MSAAALSATVDSHKPIGDDTPPLRRNQASRIAHLKRQPLRHVIYLPKGPAKRLPRPGGKATSRRTVFPRKLCLRQFRMQLRQINLCLLRVQQQTDSPIPPIEKQEVKCSAPSILTAKPSAFSDTAHPRCWDCKGNTAQMSWCGGE